MSEQIAIELVDARRFPVGADRIPEKGMHFRVWALLRKTVKLVMNPQGGDVDPLHWPVKIELQSEANGYRVDGAVLSPDALVIRFFGENPGDDRLLLVNLSRDLHLVPAPEPLLAPPKHRVWDAMWFSEDPRYGGMGMPPWPTQGNWYLQGESAVVLNPVNQPKEAVNHE